MPIKVAVVGSGIAGLAAAHALRDKAAITLLEAGAYFGGHTHTVEVTLPTHNGPVTHGVDTGFLVFNERTYANLIALMAELGVATAKAEMSFSVQTQNYVNGRALVWSGTSLSTVFAQRTNLFNPRFWGMLRDLLLFNTQTTRLALNGTDAQLRQPLGDFLDEQGYGKAFRDWYFLPMMACIWSCPTAQMLKFPVSTMIRFCHNHGLLQVTGRPQWWTVLGGARHYVDAITAHISDKRLDTPVLRIEHLEPSPKRPGQVRIHTAAGVELFDKVIIATHSDQALAMLAEPSPAEREVLGAIRYQANHAVLHTDASVLPQPTSAWAAWNYQRAAAPATEGSHVCLHYLINRLQPLPWQQPVIVSLNPIDPVAPERIIGSYDYAHPVLDLGAISAQTRVPELQGRHDRYFAGAWMGYGFHEDGLKAGLAAARQLLSDL